MYTGVDLINIPDWMDIIEMNGLDLKFIIGTDFIARVVYHEYLIK